MFPEGRILDFVIVGIVALIVVGPKDLPILMRKVGQFLAHMRGMAAEFRASFDEMARQSELDELRREVEALRTGQLAHPEAAHETNTDVQGVFDDIHASLRGGAAQMHPIMSHQYPAGGPENAPENAPESAPEEPSALLTTAEPASEIAAAPPTAPGAPS